MKLTVIEPTEARFLQPGCWISDDGETLYVDEVSNRANGNVGIATLESEPGRHLVDGAPGAKQPKRRWLTRHATDIVGVVPEPGAYDLLAGQVADALEARHGDKYAVMLDGYGLIEGRNAEPHTAFVDLTPTGTMEIRNMRDEVVATVEPPVGMTLDADIPAAGFSGDRDD